MHIHLLSAVGTFEQEEAQDQAKKIDVGKTNTNSNGDLENSKEQYAAVFTELDAAKQELRRIRHDHSVAMEEKSELIKEEQEAGIMIKVNLDKAGEISKEIMSVHETIEHVKLAAMEAKQEQEKIVSEKNVQKLAHKTALEESAKKLVALREQIDPEMSKDLETQFAKTKSKIKQISKEIMSVHETIEHVKLAAMEAKQEQEKIVSEKNVQKLAHKPPSKNPQRNSLLYGNKLILKCRKISKPNLRKQNPRLNR
ncbi:hypothetical protein L1887_16335 [Cichorium endivia]|nr:hypothetical protein L1887_16335 [Cichorium endivia]